MGRHQWRAHSCQRSDLGGRELDRPPGNSRYTRRQRPHHHFQFQPDSSRPESRRSAHALERHPELAIHPSHPIKIIAGGLKFGNGSYTEVSSLSASDKDALRTSTQPPHELFIERKLPRHSGNRKYAAPCRNNPAEAIGCENTIRIGTKIAPAP